MTIDDFEYDRAASYLAERLNRPIDWKRLQAKTELAEQEIRPGHDWDQSMYPKWEKARRFRVFTFYFGTTFVRYSALAFLAPDLLALEYRKTPEQFAKRQFLGHQANTDHLEGWLRLNELASAQKDAIYIEQLGLNPNTLGIETIERTAAGNVWSRMIWTPTKGASRFIKCAPADVQELMDRANSLSLTSLYQVQTPNPKDLSPAAAELVKKYGVSTLYEVYLKLHPAQ
jgi:hypothetical protein